MFSGWNLNAIPSVPVDIGRGNSDREECSMDAEGSRTGAEEIRQGPVSQGIQGIQL